MLQTKEGPNMDYFSAVRHSASDTIHLLVGVPGQILHFTSTDGGESWLEPTSLTGPAPWPHAPTVGHAVELASGDLIVPACCSAGSCALMSSDAGKSWKVVRRPHSRPCPIPIAREVATTPI